MVLVYRLQHTPYTQVLQIKHTLLSSYQIYLESSKEHNLNLNHNKKRHIRLNRYASSYCPIEIEKENLKR